MRIWAVAFAATLAFAAAAFPIAEEQKLPVVFVTDTVGLGDKAANDAAWEGVKRAANEFSSPIAIIQSKDAGEYVTNLTDAAKRARVVVSTGARMTDAVRTAARANTSTFFVHVVGEIDGLPNVVSYNFRDEEVGFLAGVVAALYTRTGAVGEVAPSNSAAACGSGFSAGVTAVSSSMGKRVAPVFPTAPKEEADDGRILAGRIVSRGCDVVFVAVGGTAADARNALEDKTSLKVIPETAERNASPAGQVLAAVIDRVDVAVFEGIKMAVDVAWEGGYKVLGYRDGAIELSASAESGGLTEGDIAIIDRAKDLLGRAEITVPSRQADLDKWSPPDLVKRAE